MQFIEAAHHWAGREGQTARFLVIHGTAGGTSAVGTANYFANPATQASAHYVIGVDGEVVQCVQESDAAWGNGALTAGYAGFWNALNGINPNLVSISIEHCKAHDDNSDVLTPAQKTASFNLVLGICQRNNIPMRWADASGGITGHYSLDPVNRSRCPGPYPWDELMAFLNSQGDEMLQITDPFAAAHFKQVADNRWHCDQTNQDVAYAVLDYFRRIGGAVRLPITGEMGLGNGATWQLFEAGAIVYDPKHVIDHPTASGPCYLAKLDASFVKNLLIKPYVDAANNAANSEKAAEAQVQSLQAQVAQLTAQLKGVQGPDPVAVQNAINALNSAIVTLQPFAVKK